MSDLKPFGWHHSNCCPKCATQAWSDQFEFVAGTETTVMGGEREFIGREYLKVTCRRCGFQLPMECANV